MSQFLFKITAQIHVFATLSKLLCSFSFLEQTANSSSFKTRTFLLLLFSLLNLRSTRQILCTPVQNILETDLTNICYPPCAEGRYFLKGLASVAFSSSYQCYEVGLYEKHTYLTRCILIFKWVIWGQEVGSPYLEIAGPLWVNRNLSFLFFNIHRIAKRALQQAGLP